MYFSSDPVNNGVIVENDQAVSLLKADTLYQSKHPLKPRKPEQYPKRSELPHNSPHHTRLFQLQKIKWKKKLKVILL